MSEFDIEARGLLARLDLEIEVMQGKLNTLRAKRDGLRLYLGDITKAHPYPDSVLVSTADQKVQKKKKVGRKVGSMRKGSTAHRIYTLLNKQGSPLHIRDLLALLGKGSDRSAYNYLTAVLSSSPNFRSLGKGVYGLTSWSEYR